jgi:hypothetical protein
VRVSRMSEAKYQKLLSVVEALQNDARKIQDRQMHELTTMFADILYDVVLAHKFEEVEEAGEV